MFEPRLTLYSDVNVQRQPAGCSLHSSVRAAGKLCFSLFNSGSACTSFHSESTLAVDC